MSLSFAAIVLSSVAGIASAATPSEIQWSSNTHGPDGPWYAVTVAMGNLSVPVDLFPANYGPSNILVVDYCRHTQSGLPCSSNKGGFWDPSTTRANNSLYSVDGPANWMFPITSNPAGGILVDTQTIPVKSGSPLTAKVGVNVVVDGTYTIGTAPQNQTYDYTLGTLSLGSPNQGVYFANSQNIAANFTPNNFYLDGEIPSASFGLHVGSVSSNIAPSLVYGGYDQARVLGPVITQNFGSAGQTQLRLKDVSLGTSAGAMPASLQNRALTGLLNSNGTSGMSSAASQVVTVDINPGVPYIVLPAATCQAITAGLPMTYDSDFQMWLWNTNDPEYQRLVNGANYLGFTFTQLDIPDVTIKIPFQLLNLTLSAPLTTNQLRYFPCFASTSGGSALGRAFLQGAFFGGNWMPEAASSSAVGTWFLAQAPGPNVGDSDIAAITANATSIGASSTTWESTWSNTWQPLQSAASIPTDPNTAPASSGLSTGAQAGIGVGCGVVGLALLAGLAVWYRRRRQRSADDTYPEQQHVPPPTYEKLVQGYVNFNTPVEAPERADTRYYELSATEARPTP